MKESKVTSTLLILVASLVLSACQKATFSSPDASGKVEVNGDKQPANTGSTPTTTTTGDVTQTKALPKVKFYAPVCKAKTDCLVEFSLEKAMAEVLGFLWATNDTIYLTAAPAGQPPYGRPNVDYVPASGAITFQPGETVKKVYIKDISTSLQEINIIVNMSSCTYGTDMIDCRALFGQ